MKIKIQILLLAFFILTGCGSVASKGKFFEGRSFKNGKTFVHGRDGAENNLLKIWDEENNGYNYYSWKLIRAIDSLRPKKLTWNEDYLLGKKRNTKESDAVSISVFHTITNRELKRLKLDQLAYVQNERNIELNNLYFIDNYRCIYLSYDDERGAVFGKSDSSHNLIPMFFDYGSYESRCPITKIIGQYINGKPDPECETNKRLVQYLRGYYTLEGEDLFIHFESPKDTKNNFFVKAKFYENQQKIEFVSLTIPNSTNENIQDGYNREFYPFSTIFNSKAQPVFESIEPVADVIYPDQNYVSMGFELNRKPNRLNLLHKRLLDKYGHLEVKDTMIIKNIIYDKEKECQMTKADRKRLYHSEGVRTYFLTKGDFFNDETVYEVEECIGLDEITDVINIETW